MLKREDLEAMRGLRGTEWALEDEQGRAIVDFDAPVKEKLSTLLAASPKLAIACLKAREALRHLPPSHAMVIAYQEVISALSAAGVEVEL